MDLEEEGTTIVKWQLRGIVRPHQFQQLDETMRNDTVDPAFRPLAKNKPGFHVWRIEQMKVVPIPKPQWGIFYSGDAYIIYSSKETRGRLDQRIHFWLGSTCSQDEQGVAAYKTVELDDYLGGDPVQHREMQNNESKEFLSYFRQGLRYKDGGVKSAFNNVDRDAFDPVLYQIKGKRRPRMRQVPMTWESFNSGDVFINDQGMFVFVWNGKHASRQEMIRAMEIGRGLRDERSKSNLVVVEEGTESEMTPVQQRAWGGPPADDGGARPLDLSRMKVKSAESGGNDEAAEKRAAQEIKLYRCTDEGGTLRVVEVSMGPLKYSMLDSKDVFIVDNGQAGGVWVWCGKDSSQNEKRAAMTNALSFVEKLGRHAKSVQVTKVHEEGEPAGFRYLFQGWPAPKYSGRVTTINRIAKTVQTKFDASTLHNNQALAAETKMVDDGSGEVKIWRVHDFDLVAVDRASYGQFYGGDCYVILYTYKLNGSEEYIIYFWLGRKSTADERGTAALLTVKMDDDLGGKPVQVRVAHGKEPPHFLAIFQGRLIIYDGGKAGWSKAERDQTIGDTYLLRVHGTTALNTKAEQVPTSASSLNSNDTFVLVTKTQIFIWCGKGTTGDEREMAKTTARVLSRREYTLVWEGSEPEPFWNALGGKKEYASDKRLQIADVHREVRLFQVSNARGYMHAEEIDDFVQDDLVPEDVMLLDVGDDVFVWIGNDSNEQERKAALEIASQYVESDPSQERASEEVTIYTVKQGREPPTFTGFFPHWDYTMWSKVKTYEELKRQYGDENELLEAVDQEKEEVVQMDLEDGKAVKSFEDYAKYSIEELRQGDVEDLVIHQKEMHLSADDFVKVFGIGHEEFALLPAWKQKMKKQKVGLF